jgi:muramidase (phage lysozyme)
VNPRVPKSAALLLDLIGSLEAPLGYGVIYGNRQHLLARPLTEMRLGEIQIAQQQWANAFGSSAAGRYQVVRTTLSDMIRKLRLGSRRRFDPDLQDLIAYRLLRRRGFDRFVVGELPLAVFALELAKEWASLPVLARMQGAHRLLEAGETYYAGDNRNRALVEPAEFKALLQRCLTIDSQ